jgi:hypothetical protein
MNSAKGFQLSDSLSALGLDLKLTLSEKAAGKEDINKSTEENFKNISQK